MCAAAAAAMWDNANISIRAQRVILKHLFTAFGRRLTVPESTVKALAVNAITPDCGVYILDKEKISYWTKDIEVVICNQLASMLLSEPTLAWL